MRNGESRSGSGENDWIVDVFAVEIPVAPEERKLSLQSASGRASAMGANAGRSKGALECNSRAQRAVESHAVLTDPVRNARTLRLA